MGLSPLCCCPDCGESVPVDAAVRQAQRRLVDEWNKPPDETAPPLTLAKLEVLIEPPLDLALRAIRAAVRRGEMTPAQVAEAVGLRIESGGMNSRIRLAESMDEWGDGDASDADS